MCQSGSSFQFPVAVTVPFPVCSTHSPARRFYQLCVSVQRVAWGHLLGRRQRVTPFFSLPCPHSSPLAPSPSLSLSLEIRGGRCALRLPFVVAYFCARRTNYAKTFDEISFRVTFTLSLHSISHCSRNFVSRFI